MFIKNNFNRAIALLLAGILMVMIIPVSAYSIEIPENAGEIENQNHNIVTPYAELQEESPILEEEKMLRDEFTKHYIDSKGNRYAVVFPEQVHYLENNSWIEVDNTISWNESAKRYSSNNKKFKTQFSEESDDDQLVTIEDGSYKLSWSVSFVSITNVDKERSSFTTEKDVSIQKITKSKAVLSEINDDLLSKVKNIENISDLGKAVSGIRYNGVFADNVDLRYSVLHGKVEEDIILNSPEGFASYMLTVDTHGLIATKREDNSVTFSTSDGEIIFTLGAPWMKDSYASVSDDIEVNVFQSGNEVHITYIPNAEWLNDESRVYPVLIDPSFTTRYYTNNYIDTYVYSEDSASTTRPTETTMAVGSLGGKRHFAYIKILNVINLTGKFSVDEATLHFWATTTTPPALNIYEVIGDWAPTTITYANQPYVRALKSNQTGAVMGTVSKYSVDLTEWLDSFSYKYYNLSDYFNGENWYGFKIGTTNATDEYTQICSSEYTTKSYRPVITFKYHYQSCSGIEDGAVYSFINSASNKCLTVDSSTMPSGNAYQYEKDNSRSQAFRLDYNATNDCYRIRTMCSDDGYGSVLEVPTYIGTITDVTGYTTSNVRVHNYSSAWADDQDWLIYPYNNSDLYLIVLRADPHLALTACGTSNGSASGNSSTSAGNVVLSQFTGTSSQLWKIESGGIQITNATNIKDVDEGNETYSILEGETWQSFCCPVTEFGDTVTWQSDNTRSVAVDSTGHITAGTAGIATVYADIEHADGVHSFHSCTIYVVIADGVYGLNNVSNNYRLEYEDITDLSEGARLEVYDSGTAVPVQGFRMFKIKYLGEGLYSIRSMMDCAMGWTGPSTSLVMTTIGTSDDTVPATAKWLIKSNANGYYIHSTYGVSRTVTAGASSGDDITLSSYRSTNQLQNWMFIKVTEQYHGVTIKNSVSSLAVGRSATFDAVVFSTLRDVHGGNGITWSVTNGTGSATINSATGELTGVSSGSVTVRAQYILNPYTTWETITTVTITKKAIIIVPGIMGTELVAGPGHPLGEGTMLWSSSLIEDYNSGVLSEINLAARIATLKCDVNGNSVNSIIPYNNIYGAANTYKDLYNALQEEFSYEYDIEFFAYDWRLSNAISAQELDDFISDNGYDGVKLVCHSMGGLVASGYLALGSNQRAVVEEVITLGSPLLGTTTVPYLWGNEEDIVSLFSGIANGFEISDFGLWVIDKVALYYNVLDDIIGDFPSMYEMFPSQKYFDSEYAGKTYLVTSFMGANDLEITTYAETQERLNSYLPYYNENLMDAAEAFHSSLYLGNSHVTELVNSYYIAGCHLETSDKIEYNMWDWYEYTSTEAGDSLVAIWSATLGDRAPDRTFFAEGCYHMDLAKNYSVLQCVKRLLNGDTSIADLSNISEQYTAQE